MFWEQPGSGKQQVWGHLVARPLREVSGRVTNALRYLEQKLRLEFPKNITVGFCTSFQRQSVGFVPVRAHAGIHLEGNGQIGRGTHPGHDLRAHLVDRILVDLEYEFVMHLHDHAGRRSA